MLMRVEVGIREKRGKRREEKGGKRGVYPRHFERKKELPGQQP